MPPKRQTPAATASARVNNTRASESTVVEKTRKRKAAEDGDAPASKRAKSQPATAAADKPKRRAKAPSAGPSQVSQETTSKKSNAMKKAAPSKTPAKAPTKAPAKKPSTSKSTPTISVLLNLYEQSVSDVTDELLPDKQKQPPAKTPAKRKTTKQEPEEDTSRKSKTPAPSKATPAPRRTPKPLPEINEPPNKLLEVLICGEGDNGELGLGSSKKSVGVKRPRYNHLLDAQSVGVVDVACGGMHVVALTFDDCIYTWGVNDQGALGRDTTWNGGVRDMDDASSGSDDENEDTDLNPFESQPMMISPTAFPEGTRFSQVAAGDSCSFAVTTTGQVYGWGTFRANEGILGFSPKTTVQRTPVLIEGLKKITKIVCGANHCYALDNAGKVFAWGSSQQMQLGRKTVERVRGTALVPSPLGFTSRSVKVSQIASGAYHGFAVDQNDNVYAWGLNNFGETGHAENAGEGEAVIIVPTKVDSLSGRGLHSIQGGEHHSVAVTGSGDCLVWGRADGGQLGIDVEALPERDTMTDKFGRPRIVITPQAVPALKGRTKTATTCSDHCIAVTNDGEAWSWGFSATYQTGQGTDEDIWMATKIENTATKQRKITGAGCGGQFSLLTAYVDSDGDVAMTNGEGPSHTS